MIFRKFPKFVRGMVAVGTVLSVALSVGLSSASADDGVDDGFIGEVGPSTTWFVGQAFGIEQVPNAVPQLSNFDVYGIAGTHEVNGRVWRTDCEPYSSTQRCLTMIWATSVVGDDEIGYQLVNGWVFNNLTYLALPRSNWSDNPLGYSGAWVSEDGREWRTECDTAVTGQDACRSYIVSTVVEAYLDDSTGERRFRKVDKEVFNNMVRFGEVAVDKGVGDSVVGGGDDDVTEPEPTNAPSTPPVDDDDTTVPVPTDPEPTEEPTDPTESEEPTDPNDGDDGYEFGLTNVRLWNSAVMRPDLLVDRAFYTMAREVGCANESNKFADWSCITGESVVISAVLTLDVPTVVSPIVLDEGQYSVTFEGVDRAWFDPNNPPFVFYGDVLSDDLDRGFFLLDLPHNVPANNGAGVMTKEEYDVMEQAVIGGEPITLGLDVTLSGSDGSMYVASRQWVFYADDYLDSSGAYEHDWRYDNGDISQLLNKYDRIS